MCTRTSSRSTRTSRSGPTAHRRASAGRCPPTSAAAAASTSSASRARRVVDHKPITARSRHVVAPSDSNRGISISRGRDNEEHSRACGNTFGNGEHISSMRLQAYLKPSYYPRWRHFALLGQHGVTACVGIYSRYLHPSCSCKPCMCMFVRHRPSFASPSAMARSFRDQYFLLSHASTFYMGINTNQGTDPSLANKHTIYLHSSILLATEDFGKFQQNFRNFLQVSFPRECEDNHVPKLVSKYFIRIQIIRILNLPFWQKRFPNFTSSKEIIIQNNHQ